MAKILIVDDEPQTTTLFENLVKGNGHQVVSVNNSWTAIETIKAEVPNVILMDIMMPKVNGLELCRMIKAHPDIKHIPVIMVSALGDAGTQRDSFNAGAQDFLTKPVRVHDFNEKLSTILKEQQ